MWYYVSVGDTMIRVQQHIVRSGRLTCSARSFETIPDALREMKVRIHLALMDLPRGKVTTNRDDRFAIEVNGREMRVFTLVARRGSEPIPFGHLLKVARPTVAKEIVGENVT